MANHIGQRLGNYRLTHLLGQGGFAEVYLGEHIHLDTQAAIKVLLTQLESSEIGQFRNEARLIAHLLHPHIVRVLDFGVEQTTPFLVMDYAPGGTLRQRHPRGRRLPLSTVMAYVQQIVPALQYAHEHKLIHRDIKPENLLVGCNNEILLSDFNIALIAQSSRHQSTQDMAGTIAYMAPEQINAHPRPASDQYSLGIVVYEWLCGERPFHGSFTEVAIQHGIMPPPPLRAKVPDLSPAVEQVVLTALAKDPRQRFASVQAFATALEQASRDSFDPTVLLSSPPYAGNVPRSQSSPPVTVVIESADKVNKASETHTPPALPIPQNLAFMSTEAAPLTPPETFSLTQPDTSPNQGSLITEKPPGQPRPNFSRRKVVIGGLAGLAAVGAASTLSWWIILQNSANPVYSSNPDDPSPHKISHVIYEKHSECVRSVAWSRDGKLIASGSLDKTVQIWKAANASLVFPYYGHSGGVLSVAWSPDGQFIASGSADQTVQIWKPTDGSKIHTCRGHSSEVNSVVWSPDGKFIVSGSSDQTVRIWRVTDGKNVFIYRGHPSNVKGVAWSPDGKLIASGGVDQTVQVWKATDGSLVYTYPGHSGEVNGIAWSPDGNFIASGSLDKTVQVWKATDGSTLDTYRGHSASVLSLAWSPPDGKLIASGSFDNTVQVWRVADMDRFYTYDKHSGQIPGVLTVEWSPDGKFIASGAWDKTVRVWKVKAT
jgi:eukaryotic-like serine/threonine-protein kinase